MEQRSRSAQRKGWCYPNLPPFVLSTYLIEIKNHQSSFEAFLFSTEVSIWGDNVLFFFFRLNEFVTKDSYIHIASNCQAVDCDGFYPVGPCLILFSFINAGNFYLLKSLIPNMN